MVPVARKRESRRGGEVTMIDTVFFVVAFIVGFCIGWNLYFFIKNLLGGKR